MIYYIMYLLDYIYLYDILSLERLERLCSILVLVLVYHQY